MKIKTSELEGAALDWSVACAVKANARLFNGRIINVMDRATPFHNSRYSPSTDWSQCGHLIESLGVTIIQQGAFWCADLVGGHCQYAERPMVATCRAIVAARIGDDIEVPDELVTA